MDPAQLKAEVRAAGVLDASDAASFTDSRASLIQRADGKFLTEVHYARADASVRIQTWSPEGAFNLYVPQDSPVKEIKQTTLAGHPAATILVTAAVTLGNPPRQVYVEVGGNYYSILAEGFTSNDQVLEMTGRIIAEVSR